MEALSNSLMISENQLKAVYDFSSRLEKECPGCQVTNFQNVEKQGVEVLIQGAEVQYLNRICELSIEVGDQYELVIIPTPIWEIEEIGKDKDKESQRNLAQGCC